MNRIAVFDYSGKIIRTVEKDGEVWFVAKDVCDLLEVSNNREAVSRLSNSMKGVDSIDTLGGHQQMVIINEAGLYKLAFTSRKDEAEAFTDYVAGTILPTIRKHGAYMTPDTLEKMLADPDTMIALLTNLKAEQVKRIAAETKVLELAPKADFYDAVAGSSTAISIGDMAKVLNIRGMGRNKLFLKLRDDGILDNRNIPYQNYIDRGYFRVIEQKYTTPDGETHITFKTLVYQRGLDYVRKVVSA